MPSRIICVSHTTGAGGESVGRTVSDRLGFRYVDDEVVESAADSVGLDPAVVSNVERRKSLVARVLDRVAETGGRTAATSVSKPRRLGPRTSDICRARQADAVQRRPPRADPRRHSRRRRGRRRRHRRPRCFDGAGGEGRRFARPHHGLARDASSPPRRDHEGRQAASRQGDSGTRMRRGTTTSRASTASNASCPRITISSSIRTWSARTEQPISFCSLPPRAVRAWVGPAACRNRWKPGAFADYECQLSRR